MQTYISNRIFILNYFYFNIKIVLILNKIWYDDSMPNKYIERRKTLKKLLLILGMIFTASLSFSLAIQGENIVDNYGNTIPKKQFKKIVVTDPGAIEILLKIGAKNSISAIGKTKLSKILPEKEVDQLEVIGDIVNLNLEKVVQHKPDLIIINPMMSKNIDSLKKMGFLVIVSGSSNLENIISSIEALGSISGQVENAKALAEESRRKLKKVREKSSQIQNLRGAILFSVSPMMSFSEDSLPGNVLKELGVENIAKSIPGQRPILSSEYLLRQNPDFLAGAMSIHDANQILEASSVISKTKAGKYKNIFIVDSSSMLRSSYRIFDEIETLREKLEEISKEKH